MLRGSGRQYIGAIMNFVGYYIIGLPLGITLAIKVKWGVLGLWIGMAAGNIVHVSHFAVGKWQNPLLSHLCISTEFNICSDPF